MSFTRIETFYCNGPDCVETVSVNRGDELTPIIPVPPGWIAATISKDMSSLARHFCPQCKTNAEIGPAYTRITMGH